MVASPLGPQEVHYKKFWVIICTKVLVKVSSDLNPLQLKGCPCLKISQILNEIKYIQYVVEIKTFRS